MAKEKQIVDAAKLLFQTKGFHYTSVQDILKHSGVSKGTFYNHFSSKSQLILSIIQEVDAKVEEQQKQLLIEGNIHSKQTLYSQLRVKHALYSSENILDLYNIALAENDEKLSQYMQENHYNELNWLAKRLIDVYGMEIEANAMDIATHFTGGLGYQMRYSNQMNLNTNNSSILDYNILRLEKNIEITKQAKQILFPFNFGNWNETEESIAWKIRNLLDQINHDINTREEKELIDFILEECEQHTPIRWSVCEGAVRQLHTIASSLPKKEQQYQEVVDLIVSQARKNNR
ncbi:TetR family transcriptional regulator [Agaribacter marinus]|uniref:TetR/AcrR family transcriptional regulator n=1 Tax=Virgibacillus salarius TaxID=447199 RepID=A0A941DWZ5_9BACI|nr:MULTISPECIES: TetR/AcrR family transcriptional regulator [Bacillaceae]MBR7797226.1 TetR/AcrR family transcriptional regulator [Virgibacillus salarius]NAZ09935.1 TetR family transcriptional regulator [Agaribacter marinus]